MSNKMLMLVRMWYNIKGWKNIQYVLFFRHHVLKKQKQKNRVISVGSKYGMMTWLFLMSSERQSWSLFEKGVFKNLEFTVLYVYVTGLSLNGQNPTTSHHTARPRWRALALWTWHSKWASRTSTVTKETANILSSSQMSGWWWVFL